jgi:stage III sporulation protein AB
MLKILGSLIIVAAASGVGLIYSGVYVERVRQIREMQYALQILETEMLYSALPLVEALEFTSKKSTSAIEGLLDKIAQILKAREKDNVYDAFKEAYKTKKDELCFGKEEIDVLEAFMQSLGNSDIEGQKKNFNITIKKLEELEKKAEAARSKSERLYKYLGVCAGLLIVIILV